MDDFPTPPLDISLLTPPLSPQPSTTFPLYSPFSNGFLDFNDNFSPLINNYNLDEGRDFSFDVEVQMEIEGDGGESLSEQFVEEEKEGEQEGERDEGRDSQPYISYTFSATFQQIKAIILFLSKTPDLSPTSPLLLSHQHHLTLHNPSLTPIFTLLLRKFSTFRKTKEQMTKFILRKTFKYLADKYQNTNSKKETKQYIPSYLEERGGGGREKYCLSFQKDTEEKTMNKAFLKKVFGCREFVQDYREFLEGELKRVVQEDQERKVDCLTRTIKRLYEEGKVEELKRVRKMPWTEGAKEQTMQLAKELMILWSGEKGEKKRGRKPKWQMEIEREKEEERQREIDREFSMNVLEKNKRKSKTMASQGTFGGSRQGESNGEGFQYDL